MTMELVRLWELLAASFLCLTLLTDPTEACACEIMKPQKAYCSAPLAVKVRVDSIFESAKTDDRTFEITITKVFKGPEKLKNIHRLKTKKFDCGYKHPTPLRGDDYVFTVQRYGRYLSITLCDFKRKWNDLSAEEKRGFEGEFAKSCG